MQQRHHPEHLSRSLALSLKGSKVGLSPALSPGLPSSVGGKGGGALFTIGVAEEDRNRRWYALTAIVLTTGLFPH